MNTSPRILVCVLLGGAVTACRRAPPSPPPAASRLAPARSDAASAPSTTAAVAPLPPAPPSGPAAPGLIELLHATNATVGVSSVVENHTERPENLVDGDPDTAWSSRTGQLEGAAIVFRVPPDATVDSVRLTVGMTRVRDAGDLFTMNPRISAVTVEREGEAVVSSFRLDPNNRGLQTIPVHRPGGFYRVEVTAVTPGSERAWREVSVSELEVWGTVPAPRAERRPPPVRVGDASDVLPTAPLDLATVRAIPPGCLAWSTRDRAAACAVGEWGHNLPMGAGEYQQARWQLAFIPAGAAPRTELAIAPPDASPGDFEPARNPPPLAQRQALAARLRAGGYVSLATLRHRLLPGEAYSWAPGASLRWTRRQTSPGGANAAPLYADRLEARFVGGDAGAPAPLVAREGQPVGSATIDVYAIPGGRYLAVASYAGYGDEGVSGFQSEAWLCDAVERACR